MIAIYTVAKRKPEKFQACMGFELMASAILGQCLDFLLSYQTNWELVILSAGNKQEFSNFFYTPKT